MADHYLVLGVAPTATAEEIKRLFKKLAIKYHPDKTDDAKHHEIFLQINKAYEILKDSKTRSQYDNDHGFAPRHGYGSATSFRYPEASKSYSYYSYQSTSGATNTGTYFGFYQLQAKAQSEAAEALREARRRAKRDQESEARAAALLAQKKMKEEMERRQQEYIRERQRLRDEEERRKREHLARVQLEEQLRAQRELQKQQQQQEQEQQQQQQEEERYEQLKREAHLRHWNESGGFGGAGGGAGAQEEPIVVEDDEEPNNTIFEDCHSDNGNGTSIKQEQGSVDVEEVSRGSVFGDLGGVSEPEVVELNSPDAQSAEEYGASPKRPNDLEQSGESMNRGNHYASKKPKIDMSDLRLTLGGSGLDDVDFSDMKELLPNAPGKTRKASVAINRNPHKKPKFTEYSDGTSRAETLYTPINKQTSRRNNSITASDLAPADFDENRLIFLVTPPTISVSDSLSGDEWNEYINKIHIYERKFAQFRKAVFEYQAQRLEKDEAHHNIIYSDTSCLDAYQTCLLNDMLLMQSYSRALSEFKHTLKAFKKNCEAVQGMW